MVEKEVGEVTNYFAKVKAAAIKLSAPLKVGDKIRLVGGEKNVEMTVDSMQIDRVNVKSAKKDQRFVNILTSLVFNLPEAAAS